MSPTAAAFAPTSAPHSCPDAPPIPPRPTPEGPKERPLALPAFKLIQIPGEDDPSAFFCLEILMALPTPMAKTKKAHTHLPSLSISLSKKKTN